MSGHTPGPWRALHQSGRIFLLDSPGGNIGDCAVNNRKDACLIAAAPDLLDALEAYHARHRCGCGHPACNDCERDRAAEAALAKARGGEA